MTYSILDNDKDWCRPSYKIRLRGSMYLWGSKGITQNLAFSKPLLLHIHNDVFGEPIELGTQVASGAQQRLGTLQPGECVSVPVQGVSGVFAVCKAESTVMCLIAESR